jgi:protein-disulfide isomerase
MTQSIASRLLAALTSKEGAVIAAPLVLGLAGILTLSGGEPAIAPATPTPTVAAAARPAAAVVAAPAPVAVVTTAVTTPTAPAPVVTPTAKAPTPVAATGFSAAQRTEIEAIIKSYLLAHPEVMVDVSKELEKRQASLQADSNKKIILERKATIFRAATDYVAGNPKGEITVVEFFDYNCGWCKKAVDEVTKLTKADPQVRIVLKELPIFGENSTIAAKAAMASIKQASTGTSTWR